MEDLLSFLTGNIRKQGITVNEFCAQAGLSRQKFYRFVKEPRRFTDENLRAMQNVLSLNETGINTLNNLFYTKQTGPSDLDLSVYNPLITDLFQRRPSEELSVNMYNIEYIDASKSAAMHSPNTIARILAGPCSRDAGPEDGDALTGADSGLHHEYVFTIYNCTPSDAERSEMSFFASRRSLHTIAVIIKSLEDILCPSDQPGIHVRHYLSESQREKMMVQNIEDRDAMQFNLRLLNCILPILSSVEDYRISKTALSRHYWTAYSNCCMIEHICTPAGGISPASPGADDAASKGGCEEYFVLLFSDSGECSVCRLGGQEVSHVFRFLCLDIRGRMKLHLDEYAPVNPNQHFYEMDQRARYIMIHPDPGFDGIPKEMWMALYDTVQGSSQKDYFEKMFRMLIDPYDQYAFLSFACVIKGEGSVSLKMLWLSNDGGYLLSGSAAAYDLVAQEGLEGVYKVVDPAVAAVEEPAPAEGDEGNAYTGSLMAFRGSYAPAVVPTVDPETAVVETGEGDEPTDLVLDIYEDEESHNGLIALAYDTDALVFASYEANEAITITSVHVDKDKGVITVGYAHKGKSALPILNVRGTSEEGDDYIDINEPIVTIHFTVSCEDGQCEIMTLERNDEFALGESKLFDVSGTGHDWGKPTWKWAEDYSSATAAFVCQNDESHTETVNATITSKTTEATCEEAGKTVFTATVTFDSKTFTDTKEVTIEAIGHDWGEPTWTWAEDFSTATAAFVCANDETHVKTLTATVTSEVVGHEKVYTATVELDGETYTATETVSIGVTVTFNAGEGTVDPATKVVTAGEAIGELPVPTREDGWVFIGWFTEPAASYLAAGQGTQVTAETVIEEDTTVYAHWRLPGDVNGDGKVNLIDAQQLMRYVKYHDVAVVEANVDITGDGKVNLIDAQQLMRYVKYHDVEIH